MNKIINLDNMDFHYWIDELPKLDLHNVKEETLEIARVNEGLKCTFKIALELFLHKDISSYAMLGFEYIPKQDTKDLKVKIKYVDENEINYSSKIRTSDSCKDIYSGLDKFYLNAIEECIIDFNKKYGVPAGYLNFDVAANCEVRSSPKIFGIITKILLNILIMMDNNELKEENFKRIFIDTIMNSEIFGSSI